MPNSIMGHYCQNWIFICMKIQEYIIEETQGWEAIPPN